MRSVPWQHVLGNECQNTQTQPPSAEAAAEKGNIRISRTYVGGLEGFACTAEMMPFPQNQWKATWLNKLVADRVLSAYLKLPPKDSDVAHVSRAAAK